MCVFKSCQKRGATALTEGGVPNDWSPRGGSIYPAARLRLSLTSKNLTYELLAQHSLA